MDSITAALCAGLLHANFTCVEPSYMLIEAVPGDNAEIHLVHEFGTPAACFRASLTRDISHNGFLSCLPTNEIAEEKWAQFLAVEYGHGN